MNKWLIIKLDRILCPEGKKAGEEGKGFEKKDEGFS